MAQAHGYRDDAIYYRDYKIGDYGKHGLTILKENETKFKKALQEKITQSARALLPNVSRGIATQVQMKAREILLKEATPKDMDSLTQVINLAKNIKVSPRKNNPSEYIVKVSDNGDEKLSLFLEFGTGLRGKNASHYHQEKRISYVGWKYAMDKQNYYKGGFVWKNKDEHYLDRFDKSPVIFDNGNIIEARELRRKVYIPPQVRTYKNKSGEYYQKEISGYYRDSVKKGYGKDGNRVYSKGIKGIFYMSRAKWAVQRLLIRYRRRDISELFKEMRIRVSDYHKAFDEILDEKR